MKLCCCTLLVRLCLLWVISLRSRCVKLTVLLDAYARCPVSAIDWV